MTTHRTHFLVAIAAVILTACGGGGGSGGGDAADTASFGNWSAWSPASGAVTERQITQTRSRACNVRINGVRDNPAPSCRDGNTTIAGGDLQMQEQTIDNPAFNAADTARLTGATWVYATDNPQVPTTTRTRTLICTITINNVADDTPPTCTHPDSGDPLAGSVNGMNHPETEPVTNPTHPPDTAALTEGMWSDPVTAPASHAETTRSRTLTCTITVNGGEDPPRFTPTCPHPTTSAPLAGSVAGMEHTDTETVRNPASQKDRAILSGEEWTYTSNNPADATTTRTRTLVCTLEINGPADNPAPTCMHPDTNAPLTGSVSGTDHLETENNVANPVAPADTATLTGQMWSYTTAGPEMAMTTRTRTLICTITIEGGEDPDPYKPTCTHPDTSATLAGATGAGRAHPLETQDVHNPVYPRDTAAVTIGEWTVNTAPPSELNTTRTRTLTCTITINGTDENGNLVTDGSIGEDPTAPPCDHPTAGKMALAGSTTGTAHTDTETVPNPAHPNNMITFNNGDSATDYDPLVHTTKPSTVVVVGSGADAFFMSDTESGTARTMDIKADDSNAGRFSVSDIATTSGCTSPATYCAGTDSAITIADYLHAFTITNTQNANALGGIKSHFNSGTVVATDVFDGTATSLQDIFNTHSQGWVGHGKMGLIEGNDSSVVQLVAPGALGETSTRTDVKLCIIYTDDDTCQTIPESEGTLTQRAFAGAVAAIVGHKFGGTTNAISNAQAWAIVDHTRDIMGAHAGGINLASALSPATNNRVQGTDFDWICVTDCNTTRVFVINTGTGTQTTASGDDSIIFKDASDATVTADGVGFEVTWQGSPGPKYSYDVVNAHGRTNVSAHFPHDSTVTATGLAVSVAAAPPPPPIFAMPTRRAGQGWARKSSFRVAITM